MGGQSTSSRTAGGSAVDAAAPAAPAEAGRVAPRSGQAVLRVGRLGFSYPGGFNLSVEGLELGEGERVALLGANGSGKTTLLRLLAGLLRPSALEDARLLGEPMPVGLSVRRRIGFLRQQPRLFSGSVAANIEYPLAVRGIPHSVRRAMAARAMRELGLEPLARKPVSSLSGGLRRRVALARVLAPGPRLLLLDEPLVHLDPASARLAERAIMGSGAALLVATHDMHLAVRLAARVVHLDSGRLGSGMPVNVLEGIARNGILEVPGGLRIHLPPGAPDGRMRAALDPRNIVLSRTELRSSMLNGFWGTIQSVSSGRDGMWLEIDCGLRIWAVVTRRSYDDLGLNAGEDVCVSFKATAVEILEVEQG